LPHLGLQIAVLCTSSAHVALATLRAGLQSTTIFASELNQTPADWVRVDKVVFHIGIRTLANEVSFAGVFGI
jgi:hypothetical protein